MVLKKSTFVSNKIILLFAIIASSYSAAFAQQTLTPNSTITAKKEKEKITAEVKAVIANDDFMVLDENSTETISVTANDLGLEDGISQLRIIENPESGIAEVLPNRLVRYTPKRNFVGDDIFKYRVCNKYNECDEAFVKVSVFDVDYQPIANNDTIYVNYYTQVEVDVLANDDGIFDEPLLVTIIENTENNTSEVNSNNNVIYQPIRGFWGKDSLRYEVCDKEGDCDNAWLIVYVSQGSYHDYPIPKGMSPNGDGMNDTFFIPEFKNLTNISLTIFNNWGALIFQSDNYDNNWDGIANQGIKKGKKVSRGTYYYMIQTEGSKDKFTGYLYITY